MKSKCYPLHSLNNCLYLGRGNRNELNRYFNEFYESLSSSLMRHIKNQLLIHGFNGDLKAASEDLWAEIFNEHYRLVFEKRLNSAERIQELIESLRAPSYGDLFKRKIDIWISELGSGIRNVMNFLGNSVAIEDDEKLEQLAQAMNGDWGSCKKQGLELLTQLLQSNNIDSDIESPEDSLFQEECDNIISKDLIETIDSFEAENKYPNSLKQGVFSLSKLMAEKGEVAADTIVGCEGGARFCITMDEVLDQMPKILIPTMPMLYWLTNNRIRDFMRRFAKDPLRDFSEPVHKNDDDTNEQVDPFLNLESVNSDRKVWRLMHDVQALLQQPVLEAKVFLQRSDLTKKQYSQAQTRLGRCEDRYSMHMAVFGLLVEGFTQEEIASKLGLTRDQVRGREKEIQDLLKELRNKDESGRKHDE